LVEYTTVFGSLDNYEKGGIEIVDDDPKNYVFSNIFEVASGAEPWEKIAVGKNMEYVLEVIRAEGVSGWRTCDHDEFALIMDGSVVTDLVKLETPLAAVGHEGSIAVPGHPVGPKMGKVTAGKGHMVLLPKGSAYRFSADAPSVILLQTILGDDTIQRWAEICLS
jgi:hypothetical protein